MIAERIIHAEFRLKAAEHIHQLVHITGPCCLIKDIAADQDHIGIRIVYRISQLIIQAVPVARARMRIRDQADIKRLFSVHLFICDIIFRHMQGIHIDESGRCKQIGEQSGKHRTALCAGNLHIESALRVAVGIAAPEETDHCPGRKEDSHDHDRHIVKRADDHAQTLQPGIRNILIDQKCELQTEYPDNVIDQKACFLLSALFPLLWKEVIDKQGNNHKSVECHEKRKTVHLHLAGLL